MSIAEDWWFQRHWGDFRRGARAVRLRWDGGGASGVLYDEGAPLTVSAVLAELPLRIPLVHVAWSGEMCMSVESYELDVREPDIDVREPDNGARDIGVRDNGVRDAREPENSVRLVRPGDLTWDPKFGELCVVYGAAECRLPSGPNTVVVFGALDTGLEELAQFGRARRFEGVGDAYLEAVPKAT